MCAGSHAEAIPERTAPRTGAPNEESSAPGLTGAYFRSEHFQRPAAGADVLLGVDHDWGRERGGGWSARWAGLIEGPFTGEVAFTAEATDGLRLEIDEALVIDGLEIGGPRTGTTTMTRGKKVPILLEFDTTGGRARLRLHWEWEGQPRTIVPGAALTHDPHAMPDSLDAEGPGPVFAAPPLEAGEIDLSRAVIVASLSRTTPAKAADMLHDEIAKRTRIRLGVSDAMPDDDVPAIVLGTAEDAVIPRSPSGARDEESTVTVRGFSGTATADSSGAGHVAALGMTERKPGPRSERARLRGIPRASLRHRSRND